MNTRSSKLFTQVLLVIVLFLFAKQTLIAQKLIPGGLAGNNAIVLVPNAAENAANSKKSAQQISYLNFSDKAEKIQFAPQLPNQWNWVAVFNAPAKGKTYNFFMYDSWLACTQRIMSNHRLRRFEDDITSRVSSNAYHMAFQRKQVVENEVFMLVVSPVKQKVKIALSKAEFGVERTVEYDMEAWEAKFVHIVMPPAEYTVITWQPENTSTKTVLQNNWQFYLDHNGTQTAATPNGRLPLFKASNKWSAVTVPHTWNATDIFDSRNFKDTINIMELFKRGIGWYKTSFTLQASQANKYHELQFLGANQVADVWMNGKYVGSHSGGYTGFQFDVSPYLVYNKPNELVVKVDNRFNYDIAPHSADYNFQGGIYREVYLVSKATSHVVNTKFQTPKVSHKNASVQVQTKFTNYNNEVAKVIVNLINPYSEIQNSWVQQVQPNQTNITVVDTVRNPVLWSTTQPTLYKLYVTLYNKQNQVIDQTADNVGFRYFDFDANKGFSLNGKQLKLKGVNVHQDYLNKGWAVDSAQKREDYLWMKKMGVNYVRMSHYPKHPYELYLCDSLGFVVWEEIPVVNTVGRKAYIANAKNQMVEMVERDYNRPSIIFWGVGNEYYRNFFTPDDAEAALECTRQCADISKQLDPYRYTIQAQNDLVDDRILSLTDIQGRNRYYGWYEKTYNDFEHEMEVEHKKQPTWRLLVSEYGAEGKYGHHVTNPKIFDHSETYQVNFHKAYWEVISKYDYLAGGTIWNMFDFASFAKIGNSPHINKKGMLSFDRKPKDVFYYYQSVWTDEPMIRIAGHTYTHRKAEAEKPLSIDVFSNTDSVALYINDKYIGTQTAAQGYIFNPILAEGYYTIKAIGYKYGIAVTDTTQFFLRIGKLSNEGEIKELDGDGF